MVKTIDYSKVADEQFELARLKVRNSLYPIDRLPNNQIKDIIGTYRAAIEPHFIPWMQVAQDTVSTADARYILSENIRCEVDQDHPGMLRRFSESCGVKLNKDHYRKASGPVTDMWKMISKRDGLTNLVVAATLENTSLEFIPYLKALGEKVGCKDFEYIDVHGIADIKHARDLQGATVQEMYDNQISPWRTVASAVDKTADFVIRILGR